MIKTTKRKVAGAPTPMAGLALGLGSVLWCWENGAELHGYAQIAGAVIAALLLFVLVAKFIWHPQLLWCDLSHPVVGSVVPTFAMALMVVSKAVGLYFSAFAGACLWVFAVVLHLIFLVLFIYHRARDFHLHHMVPSWFVPPIGIIVADVSFPGIPALHPFAHVLLVFGMVAYAIMLPMMIYRFMFCDEVPDAAKPTIAIMAAPASLSLAGYLTVTASPSPVIVAVLGGIAVLMTAIIYLAFFRLLRLDFSPGYAAFTFPMAIGATALFKTATWMQSKGIDAHYIAQVHGLAMMELYVASAIIGYVAIRYLLFYRPLGGLISRSQHCPQNM